MYHARFKKSHYEAGYKWGNLLYKNGSIISSQHTFVITKERKENRQIEKKINEEHKENK